MQLKGFSSDGSSVDRNVTFVVTLERHEARYRRSKVIYALNNFIFLTIDSIFICTLSQLRAEYWLASLSEREIEREIERNYFRKNIFGGIFSHFLFTV